MTRREILKTGAVLTVPAVPGAPAPPAPASTVSATAQDHRQRLLNIAECNRRIRKCLRKHLITDYLPGHVVYNLGEYPCRKPWDIDDWDAAQLDEMRSKGIRLVQVHEEWNDSQRLFGADKLSPLNAPAFRRFVEMVHRRGMKLIVYISTGFFERHDPDFRPEWARKPDLVEIFYHYARCSPASPGWRAYLLPRLTRILDEYGVDGFYNDMGYNRLGDRGVSPSADEIRAFEESPSYDGAIEDLAGMIYSDVKRRGGIVKIHIGGSLQPHTSTRIYDYLWVGEGVRQVDAMRESIKNHVPYVAPCLDMSRARINREDDLYLHSIPYMQFPVMLGGKPVTGERVALPNIHYQPEEKDFWTRHMRNIWRYYQSHPQGPYSYGWWDSCPGRPEARPTYYRWLKLYEPMTESGTWAYTEVTDSDFFTAPSPQGVVASVFANRKLYLVLANYSHRRAVVQTELEFRRSAEPDAPGTKSWELPARTLTILETQVAPASRSAV